MSDSYLIWGRLISLTNSDDKLCSQGVCDKFFLKMRWIFGSKYGFSSMLLHSDMKLLYIHLVFDFDIVDCGFRWDCVRLLIVRHNSCAIFGGFSSSNVIDVQTWMWGVCAMLFSLELVCVWCWCGARQRFCFWFILPWKHLLVVLLLSCYNSMIFWFYTILEHIVDCCS